jgi:23S rRNA (pseudouridine1915-N3)-methyltransferase
MYIRILTITHKTPKWITEGYDEYKKRLPHFCTLELVEIPAEKRLPKSDLTRAKEREGTRMLSTINKNHWVIALDVKGKLISTEQLANYLFEWQQDGTSVDLLIGGPDGLAPSCLQAAHEKWSLSHLTFPHIFVKLILAEQLYRGFSILQKHPYHK